MQDMGHKRLALEAGEDPLRNPIEYSALRARVIVLRKAPVSALHRAHFSSALVPLFIGSDASANSSSCSKRDSDCPPDAVGTLGYCPLARRRVIATTAPDAGT